MTPALLALSSASTKKCWPCTWPTATDGGVSWAFYRRREVPRAGSGPRIGDPELRVAKYPRQADHAVPKGPLLRRSDRAELPPESLMVQVANRTGISFP